MLNDINSVKFIRILGVDYNVSMIQWIQVLLPVKQIVLGLLANPDKVTIQFPEHMSNDDVVAAYSKLIKASDHDNNERSKQLDVMTNGLSNALKQVDDIYFKERESALNDEYKLDSK